MFLDWKCNTSKNLHLYIDNVSLQTEDTSDVCTYFKKTLNCCTLIEIGALFPVCNKCPCYEKEHKENQSQREHLLFVSQPGSYLQIVIFHVMLACVSGK